ncbi:DUF1715 domain-containing protein [Rutstroemia sp. NJR-2017a BVV2]|nr:DUF1715 domain-containing protein [Rutstroemia sp. NJR-2017a BVV2]
MSIDPFDEVLGLEEEFYNNGYQTGLEEGIAAGRIEGRTLGLEKGFEKYVEMGRLHGKSLIWVNRTPVFQKAPTSDSTASSSDTDPSSLPKESPDTQARELPQFSGNERLAKHIKVFYALAEAESLATDNTDDAVSDFDDRLKRAQAKVKIIERMVGEVDGQRGGPKSSGDGAIEDVSVMKAR